MKPLAHFNKSNKQINTNWKVQFVIIFNKFIHSYFSYCLVIIILLMQTTLCFAKQVTKNESLNIARQFYSEHLSSKAIKVKSAILPELKLIYVCKDTTIALNGRVLTPSTSDSAGYYYVYNIADKRGFIIVSGDDRAIKILGYSESGGFDINGLPPNFAELLDFYKKELKVLMTQPESTNRTSAPQLSLSNKVNEQQVTYSSSVAPLLGEIKWGQSFPYNNFCPLINAKRTPTGCNATAMAQVMRFYKWPVKGTGAKTYTPSNLTTPLSVDFSKTTYDWANMTETYNNSSTQYQKDAVATLMYHCGVAANMNYSLYLSTSNYNYTSRALIDNFGYDSNIQRYLRDFYTKSEWENLIKTELNAQRPVLYAGQGDVYGNSGHAFICDGYDINELYHFNWGWEGLSDGYFVLSVAHDSLLGFNYNQEILVGVQKPNTSSITPPYQLYLTTPIKSLDDRLTRSSKNDYFRISMGIVNAGINTFSGFIGIALYNDSGFVKLVDCDWENSLATDRGYANFRLDYSVFRISSVANGNYKLYCVFRDAGQDWQIMRGRIGRATNYLNVTLSDSYVDFSTPNVLPKLTLNSFTTDSNLYQNKQGNFKLNITNTGEDFNSKIRIQLKSINNDSISQVICTDYIYILSGETKSFNLSGVMNTAGKYNLYVMYDPSNDAFHSTTYTTLGSPITVDVIAKPIEPPDLILTSKISFPDSTKVSRNDALSVKLKNLGGYFYDGISAKIYTLTGDLLLIYGSKSFFLDKNEEVTITFMDNIELNPGQYIVKELKYWDEESMQMRMLTPIGYGKLTFTFVSDNTEIGRTELDKLILYPNYVTDKLFMKSEEIVKTINIYDFSGKHVLKMKPEMSGEITIPVEKLIAGVYILQSETEKGIKVSKFIKCR